MESITIQTIIQGGAVGLAALAMWIVWKLSSNHIDHNTEVLTKNTEVVDSLKDAIRELTTFLRNKN